MKSFKLNHNGDLVIENGDLVMIDGNEELRQCLERILTTNVNEWFLDIDFGLDYSAIQGKGKAKERIKLTITEAVFQEPRINQVDIKDIDIDKNRHLKVYGRATDIEGNVLDLSELGVIRFG